MMQPENSSRPCTTPRWCRRRRWRRWSTLPEIRQVTLATILTAIGRSAGPVAGTDQVSRNVY